MVAILGGLVVLLFFLLVGAWATIAARDERIAELEALHAPPTTAPWSMIRAREEPLERATDPGLPPLFDLEGNDEPTKVCQLS
jgi:hypothetical protein